MNAKESHALAGYLETLNALDCEREELYKSIRPALDALRENRASVYLAMVAELPADVLRELDYLYQRPLWGSDMSEWVKGEPPACVRESIERGEGLFTIRDNCVWGLSSRGREMMSDGRVRERIRAILAAGE